MGKFEKVTVKHWHKKAGKEAFDRFLSIIQATSPMSEEEWENPNIARAIQKYGQFVHLETDIEDNSEGVQPKQMKKLAHLKDDEIITVFNLLNASATRAPLTGYVDGDGFLSWERFFNNVLSNDTLQDKKFSSNDLMAVIYYFIEEVVQRYNFDGSFIFNHDSINELKILEQEKMIHKKFVDGEPIKNSDLSLDNIMSDRRDLWKKIQGITPQSIWMLLANPNNFSRAFVQKIQEVFEEKQLVNLSKEDQQYIGTLLNTVGENIIVLEKETILNGRSIVNRDNTFNVQSNITLLKRINKVQKLSIQTLIHYSKFLTENEDLKDDLKNKDEFTENDLSVISYIGEKLQGINGSRRNKFLKIPFQYWAIFYRYRVGALYEIEALIDLYEKNKDNKMNTPVITGKIGEYTYEILEKSNPMGLILGYATDCCQVMTDGNQGRECLINGYTNPNSSFFVVRKGKKIYAQSWIWQNKKIFCFDSIEVLGKDFNKNKDILKAYKETAKKLAKEGYEIVFAGADGNTVPNGLVDAGLYLDHCPDKLLLPFNCYSDARGEIVIFEGKEDYE